MAPTAGVSLQASRGAVRRRTAPRPGRGRASPPAPGAVMHGVLADRRALPVAALGDDHHVAFAGDRSHAGHGVALAELDADPPLRVPAHRAHLALAEANRFAQRGGDDDLVLA